MEAQVTLKVVPPENCSLEQFREWLDYEMGIREAVSWDNPLVAEGKREVKDWISQTDILYLITKRSKV